MTTFLQSICDLKVKHVPDATLWTFKFILYARDDRQVEVVDYFENYALVVPWSTVITHAKLKHNQVWATRKVNF